MSSWPLNVSRNDGGEGAAAEASASAPSPRRGRLRRRVAQSFEREQSAGVEDGGLDAAAEERDAEWGVAHLDDDVGVGDGEDGGAGGAGIVLGEDGGRGGELGSSTIEVVDEDVGDAVPGVFRVVHARADHALVAEGGEGEGERAGGVAVREERRRGLRSVAREGEGVGDGVDGGGGAVGGVAMARAETRRGARLEIGRLERQRGGRGERRGRDERTHERRQARRRRSEATPGSRARRRGGRRGESRGRHRPTQATRSRNRSVGRAVDRGPSAKPRARPTPHRRSSWFRSLQSITSGRGDVAPTIPPPRVSRSAPGFDASFDRERLTVIPFQRARWSFE